MFADDHEVMRQGLVQLATGRADIRVVGEASDGRQDCELVSRLRPDVVVMDVSMPEMEGIEVPVIESPCSIIRRNWGKRWPPDCSRCLRVMAAKSSGLLFGSHVNQTLKV